MLNRRGFSLIELLVGIIVLAVVGLATGRLLDTMLRTTSAQVATATSQGEVRTGLLALPQDFREIGYDTVPLAGSATTDLLVIARHRITFRAMRGMGFTCGTPTLTEFRVRKPVLGMRMPQLTDGFLLFVENDPNLGADDQWVQLSVASLDLNGTCGADSAVVITLAGPPVVNPGVGTTMALSNYFVGGPVRWFERVEYGPWVDASTGLAWVGVRSLSLGQPSLTPVLGPMPDTTSFRLDYFSATGVSLDPATANPLLVRSLGVTMTGVTPAVTSLAGSAQRARRQTTVSTRVALRNTLRP
jgi:prepilin-type N-terminal cleavage/methylation domain-containing protein